MSSAKAAPPPRPLDPLAGLLSYLVPGLGQIYQGRVAKGLLFLVCVYTLFFYGVYLGTSRVTIGAQTYKISSNVFLPDSADERNNPLGLPPLLRNLYDRPQFLGQFWVGVAAWPAVIQYLAFDRAQDERIDQELDSHYRELESKTKELAALGPEDKEKADELRKELEQKRAEIEVLERHPKRRHPILGQFQREPSPRSSNAVNTCGDKRLELAWVYTVIAGVLNIMVIYDAVAGPAFLLPGADPTRKVV
jgi:hypothetical protein